MISITVLVLIFGMLVMIIEFTIPKGSRYFISSNEMCGLEKYDFHSGTCDLSWITEDITYDSKFCPEGYYLYFPKQNRMFGGDCVRIK